MRRQLRAEWRKLRTVRSTVFLSVTVVISEIAFKVLLAAFQSPASLDLAAQIDLLKATLFLPLGTALVGALLMAGETRHGLAEPTYLIQPRRGLVIAAKAVIAVASALVIAGAAMALSDAAAIIILHNRGLLEVSTLTPVTIAGGAAAGCAALAAAGVGCAAAVKVQTASIIVLTALLLIVAPLASALSGPVYAVLPSGLLDSLSGQGQVHPALLAWPAAAGLLAVEIAMILAAGVRRTTRYEVT